jgi:hypothetical protein
MKKLPDTISSFAGCFLILWLVSCSNKEKAEPEPKPITSCRPIGTSTWDPLMGKFDSTYRFYDNAGRLAELEEFNSFSKKYRIIYDQTGRIDKILDKSGNDFERRFYNASGQLYKVTHTIGWAVDSLDRKTFQYDASGKIVSASLKKFGSTGTIDRLYFTKYFYNSKGLLVLDSTFNDANGQYIFYKRTVFEYEDKARVGVIDFTGWYDESLYLFAPLTHNIVSRVHKQKVIGGELEENISLKYEYNALGYATKVDFYYNGGLWYTKKIWNECL